MIGALVRQLLPATQPDTPLLQRYLAAPLITCPGRSYPVTTHYLDRSLPFGNRQALFQAVTKQIINSLNQEGVSGN